MFFSNCLSFFVGGKWRHYNVTIKRGYMDSPFSSISTPFYCLFGADGDVLHLGEELSPHDSAAGLDQPSVRLAVESWQNTNPLNKGVRKNLTPLLSDSSWITQEGSYVLSHSLVGPFVFQLMSPIQQELLNKGVRFFLTPLLTRSTRITQQGG